MNTPLSSIRRDFGEGLSRISRFWGLPPGMGAIFAALYLSPQPLSLDELVTRSGLTKGAVSTNVRALARLGLVHPSLRPGERKDYYSAETDFWKATRSILRQRENSEFERALAVVRETQARLEAGPRAGSEAEEWNFVQGRVRALQAFFDGLDALVRAVAALDSFSLGTVQKVISFLKRLERK